MCPKHKPCLKYVILVMIQNDVLKFIQTENLKLQLLNNNLK